MNSADLIRLRFKAAARDGERLGVMTQAAALSIDAIIDELKALGWSDSDALGAVSFLLSDLQGSAAERLLS
ncbi:MAG: hypothetical protein DCO99_03550 [Synechococcus sp. XM-24]|nr:MAG: hypothetical protein DCO99_03550 [Synechococcus sp. XM-24]